MPEEKNEGKISLGKDADKLQFSGWVEDQDEFNNGWIGNLNDDLLNEEYEVTWGWATAKEAADFLRADWKKRKRDFLVWRKENPKFYQKTRLH